MNERGLGTGALVGIIVTIVTVAVVIPVSLIVLTGGGGSKVEMTFTPSTLHVGDNFTMTMTVTNKESGVMTISGSTLKTYRNDQLVDTSTSTTAWENSIPPGQTVTLSSFTGQVASTISYSSGSYSPVGTWRFEVSLNTNYGTLAGSGSWTVLA